MTDSTSPGSPGIHLRIPVEIGPKLLADATAGACTVQAVILRVLSSHYAVVAPVPARGRPRKKRGGEANE